MTRDDTSLRGGLRVLVSGVVLGQPLGGVRRHNAELLPRLDALLRADGGSLTVLEGAQRIAFELPSTIERSTSGVPHTPPLRRARAESAALQRSVDAARARGTPFDVVHTAHLPAPRVAHVARTITIHDLRALDASTSSPLRRWVARGLLRAALDASACVFTVSDAVGKELVTRFALDPARVRTIGNGGDHFKPLPRAPDVEAPTLLHVGHLEPRKNVELLLEALALDRTLPDLELVGAAKNGHDERLRAHARRLGVAERVRFLGAVDDAQLAKLYARCAAVVLPAHVEGFGISALEARLAACPLAISAIDALREVAGDDAPRFSPNDARACVAAVRAALASDVEVLLRARERARERTWDGCAALWHAGLSAAARGRGA